MTTTTPFTIAVPEEKLSNLRAKLDATTFPDELDEAGWKYGAPLADIKRLVTRWKSEYDWRKHERLLNDELPMYTLDIDVKDFGQLNIHYIHQKSQVLEAIPLLFVHGWPGCFLEARKILPLLTAASHDHPSFHFVTFSLPGYGFSESPNKQGFAASQYAEVGHKLMLALGYHEYVTQGGDLGFWITRKIAKIYGSKHSKAWHTNYTLGQPPRLLDAPLSYLLHLVAPYTESERAGLERAKFISARGRGYYAQQSTQPQTLGYALADSPVGLLAWIYEKLVVWADDDYPWDDDEILTWISVYWFSRAGPAASLRVYFETTQNDDRSFGPSHTPTIPMGISYFPKELFPSPKAWTRLNGKVVFESDHDRGGHFASHEKPQELVDDLRKMFGKGGPAYGVVPGKAGYASVGL
ncbi:alpha/beta-hydrolase [Leucogyrophana mollusca]|uniref:Alpha/beta-hydrolase n=1 Tax=Leucogyrophana mollusca TaxID=85980 RepID=A0ACB8BKP7_9AGAM|nr:alpha/beta-hydrolase [Leucogyrophana mollusca]